MFYIASSAKDIGILLGYTIREELDSRKNEFNMLEKYFKNDDGNFIRITNLLKAKELNNYLKNMVFKNNEDIVFFDLINSLLESRTSKKHDLHEFQEINKVIQYAVLNFCDIMEKKQYDKLKKFNVELSLQYFKISSEMTNNYNNNKNK